MKVVVTPRMQDAVSIHIGSCLMSNSGEKIKVGRGVAQRLSEWAHPGISPIAQVQAT